MSFEKYAVAVLETNGYKLTNPRIALLKVMAKTKKPCSPYQIQSKLAGKANLSAVTIYRILNLFAELKLVHKTSLGFMPCHEFSCKNDKHCHHQFICQKCDRIEEIHLDDQNFLKKIAEKFPHIKIKSHTFEFAGMCKKCK